MNAKEAEKRLFVFCPEDHWKGIGHSQYEITCPHCKKDITLDCENNVFNSDVFVTYGKDQDELDEIEKLLHEVV